MRGPLQEMDVSSLDALTTRHRVLERLGKSEKKNTGKGERKEDGANKGK